MSGGYDQVLLFSPQNCTREVLDANLTPKRRKLADGLVAGIRQAAESHSSRYDLLIGPRGAGKTHVLAYIEKTLREEFTEDSLRVIRLSEEELGVTCHADILLAALEAMGADVDKLYDELREPNGWQAAETRLLDALDGVPTLLLIENLAIILESMEHDEHSRFRSFLQRNAHISVLAASPRLYEGSGKADHPLYNFFLLQHLDPLNRDDAHAFLIALAVWKEENELVEELRKASAKARVSAIFDMTGGNHRLLGMLSDCLQADDLKTLVEPFVRMVDRELTPYFQQRLGALPAQQAKILKVIARHHVPIQVKEIARRIPPTTEQTVSSQLRALKETGLVRSQQQGRESYYELQEPMMRLVLDIKEGRETVLPSIVALLREWYEAEELQALAVKCDDYSREYYQAALEEKLKLTASINRSAAIDMESGVSDSNSPVFSRSSANTADWLLELNRLVVRGTGLLEDDAFQDAILTFDEIVTRFGGRDDLESHKGLGDALGRKGIALGRLGRHEEAVAAFEEIVKRFAGREETALLELVAKALGNKGIALGRLGRHDEAVASFEEIVKRFAGREEAALLKLVAKALGHMGFTLGRLGRNDEALAAYEEVLKRFAERKESALLEWVAKALGNKGVALGKLGRHDEAMAAFEGVVKRFAEREETVLLEQVATALVNKGVTLGGLGRYDEAMAAYEEVIKRFAAHEEPALLDQVANAIFNKGLLLGQPGRYEIGLEKNEALLKHCAHHDDIDFRNMAAHAVGGLIGNSVDRIQDFRRVRDLPVPEEVLLLGLTQWIQSQLPMSKEKARDLERAERNLLEVFAEIDGATRVLELFSAARAHSLGDKKALLRLPLESRRLVERAYGLPES